MFTLNQLIAFEHEGSNFKLSISNLMIDVNGQSQDVSRAYLAENTAFIFTNGEPCCVCWAGLLGV